MCKENGRHFIKANKYHICTILYSEKDIIEKEIIVI